MAKESQKTPAADIPGKLKEAAQRSGKPLEVVCASSFQRAPHIMSSQNEQREAWKVHVSSYYLDGMSDKIRELDVLARRQRFVKMNDNGFNAMLEVFMSCKGFPEDEYPITFAATQTAELEPDDPPVVPSHVSLPGKHSRLGMDAAEGLLLFMSGLNSAKRGQIRRTIGLDVVRDLSEAGKGWKVQGDRVLFEGLDSALRASFFWRAMKLPAFHSLNEGLVRVQVPILVFSRPWHEIPIDRGVMGEPVPTSLSFVANLYPVQGTNGLPVPLFTLLIARERLEELQTALVNLYGKMWDWGTEAYRNPG